MSSKVQKTNKSMIDYLNEIADGAYGFEEKMYAQALREYIANYCKTKESAELLLSQIGIFEKRDDES